MALKPVTKPAEYRLICAVETANLRRAIMALTEEAWNAENARKENNFAVFHHARHIVARFIPRNEDPLAFYSTPFWSVWQPLLRPVLDSVATVYGFSKPEFPK